VGPHGQGRGKVPLKGSILTPLFFQRAGLENFWVPLTPKGGPFWGPKGPIKEGLKIFHPSGVFLTNKQVGDI